MLLVCSPTFPMSKNDSPCRQSRDHREIHLRRQDHHSTNLQFQQTLYIRSLALRLIIRIKNNDVIAQFERSLLNGLNKVREEWVGYVRNNQAESLAPAGGQIARVYVWCVTYIFNRAENSAFRFIADVARLIDDVRDGGG